MPQAYSLRHSDLCNNAVQHKTKTDYDVQQAMKKGYEKGKKIGYKKGLEAGRQQAHAEAQKLSAKVGSVVDCLKTSWHGPSAKALAEASKVKEQAKTYADNAKKQAERAVQDERNRRRSLELELEKKNNIATNLEADNKRLLRELESYRSTASNRQSNNKFKQ